MRYYFARKSLRWQLVALGAAACAAVAITGLLVVWWTGLPAPSTTPEGKLAIVRLVLVLTVTAVAAVCGVAAGVTWLVRPLHDLRRAMSLIIGGQFDAALSLPAPAREYAQLDDAFQRMLAQLRDAREKSEAAKQSLASRTTTVDRLLEFSQTIQGAGKAEQVFNTLSHFLAQELGLAGVAVLSVDADAVPATQLRAAWPATLVPSDRSCADVDNHQCPCLRQNLPKHFACASAPVRCAVDAVVALPPDHPAYCIPFTVRKTQCVVHMMLPVARAWDDDAKDLAQTYVNTAHSALISLHLLAEAERQSLTDGLTGLYNRRSMDHLMAREVALAERHGHPLSVVMIDLDKFKEVNDDHGHAAGDHLLKAFADCVRMTLRKTDLAFRYGGDEFLIALPQTPVGQAQQVVQKLRQAFGAIDFSDAVTNLKHHPTLSIGVAERSKSHNTLTLGQLLGAADAALYDAKQSNRNCVKLYSPPKAA